MSNFFITFNDMRFKWLLFLRYLSALYYAFEGMAATEFGGATYDCSRGVDPSGVTFLKQLMPNSKWLNMSVVANSLTNPGADCIADTDALLEYYEFYRPFGTTVGILFFYWLCTHAFTYGAMILVARRERR